MNCAELIKNRPSSSGAQSNLKHQQQCDQQVKPKSFIVFMLMVAIIFCLKKLQPTWLQFFQKIFFCNHTTTLWFQNKLTPTNHGNVPEN